MFENTDNLTPPAQAENKNIAWWKDTEPTPVGFGNTNEEKNTASLNIVANNATPNSGVITNNAPSVANNENKIVTPENKEEGEIPSFLWNTIANQPVENKNCEWENNTKSNISNNEQTGSNFSLQKLKKVEKVKNDINFTTEDKTPKQKRNKGKSYIFPVLYIVITLGILFVVGLLSYDKYLNLLLRTNITSSQRNYTIKYNNNLQKIKDYLSPSNESINQIDLSATWSYTDLSAYIVNQDYSFIEKKDTINTAITAYAKSITTAKNSLAESKQNIAKYGYIPIEVDTILWDDTKITTIENSLLSLETIKFASAINVFSYLDTFLNSLSKTLSLDKEEIQEAMRDISNDWEKNINLYIKKCYLNPFEYDYSCNVIGDFDRYYSIAKEEKTFNTKLFKQLIYYLDLKLEFTDIPSFNIMFQKFNANDDEITFSIDINTFKQDELELAKQWIINPHIFILTNLVNSLKQSKFIVGKDIKVDNLNVSEEVFKVGTTEFIVNNSKKVYTLPIQKNTQREIFDFVD